VTGQPDLPSIGLVKTDEHVERLGPADLLDPDSVSALAETFRMLGDSTRVRILDALSRAELCVQDIARRLGLSESAVYALDDHHIVRLFAQGLEHVQESARGAQRPAFVPPGKLAEES
jgi:predicted transcriptional regulator